MNANTVRLIKLESQIFQEKRVILLINDAVFAEEAWELSELSLLEASGMNHRILEIESLGDSVAEVSRISLEVCELEDWHFDQQRVSLDIVGTPKIIEIAYHYGFQPKLFKTQSFYEAPLPEPPEDYGPDDESLGRRKKLTAKETEFLETLLREVEPAAIAEVVTTVGQEDSYDASISSQFIVESDIEKAFRKEFISEIDLDQAIQSASAETILNALSKRRDLILVSAIATDSIGSAEASEDIKTRISNLMIKDPEILSLYQFSEADLRSVAHGLNVQLSRAELDYLFNLIDRKCKKEFRPQLDRIADELSDRSPNQETLRQRIVAAVGNFRIKLLEALFYVVQYDLPRDRSESIASK